jgi:3-dehydroquinate synthase
MKPILVHSEREYSVEIGVSWPNRLAEVLAQHNRTLILAPQSLKELLLAKLPADADVYWLPDGEAQKSVTVAETLWELCGDLNLQRNDAIVGIGGGATTDLAGFIAATWLRGIAWYAFPTSLAGMVDASVGGKTGLNTGAGKNLVGAFHSPSLVAIDLDLLSSLSDRDFAAGLAEVIKCGFIADPSILNILGDCSDVQAARKCAEDLVFKSVAVKAGVVGQDFKESKLREVLNYGHTAGHAIEKLSHYSLRHGEAVSVGLVFAAHLSQSLAGLDATSVNRHSELLSRFGLPTKTTFGFDEILSMMGGDKKARLGELRFVGLSAVGTPTWLENPSSDALKSAYESIRQ